MEVARRLLFLLAAAALVSGYPGRPLPYSRYLNGAARFEPPLPR